MKKAFHATSYTDKIWKECNYDVYYNIISDTGTPSITIFPALLNELQIHIYAGDRDLLCNVLGLERSIQHSLDESANAPEVDLKKWGNFGTKVFFGENISYYRLNASHMSPFDAPEAAREVFLDVIQDSIEDTPNPPNPPKLSNPLNSSTPLQNQSVPKSTVSGEQKSASSPSPILQETKPKEDQSHLSAAIFLLGFFFVSLFTGLFIRRKLSTRTSSQPKW